MRKLLSTAIAVGIFASLGISPVYADVASNTLPSFNNGTNVDVNTSGSNMNIQIQGGQGGVGVANFDSYNIGKGATVNYEFTAHNQTALNKVAASGGLSQIYGSITSSGCAGCGYDATGKVILVNPNGVLFGDGANINLNSFTATTFDATYDKDNNKLILTKGDNAGDITVLDGATIYGDKNVTFAANNITTYAGSKIATNVNANVGDTAYGKVKLVTADGVNFTFYNNGAVKEVANVTESADKMLIVLNGDITSGHIDARNASVNADSEINMKGATLKATKAVSGNDGNIWLTAHNKVIIEDSALETVNGGNIKITAGKKVSVANSNLNSANNVDISVLDGDIAFEKSALTAANSAKLNASGVASIQKSSKVNAKDVTIYGKSRGQVVDNSEVVAANDITVEGDYVWFRNSLLNANGNIVAKANAQDVLAQDSSLKANKIKLEAAKDVKTAGILNLNNSQTSIYAGKDVNVKLSNVGDKNNGLVAEAVDNVTIETDGTLSVSRLVAKNGDMTLTADKVIAGLPYTDETKLPGDTTSPRSYIEVLNGTFTSNTANDSYVVTESGDPVDVSEGYFNKRHHIEYGNGQEKILLVNKRAYTPVTPEPPVVTPPVIEPPVVTPAPEPEVAEVDDNQAKMLNKLPRQPEVFNNNTNITDTRTTFVDVFAAASQIEIEEDEE